jgi:hypothetical protein
MAVIKQIVILANSMKNSGRCLAGKELIRNGKHTEVGSWIRVVGSEDGAEVPVLWMLEQFGREPKLLDTIDVPLEGIVPLPDQPENWLMVRRAPWRDRGTLPVEELAELVDHPLQLWGTQKRDVDAGYVETMGEPASLYFIEPEVVGPVRAWTDKNLNESGGRIDKQQRRISLKYRRMFHEFTVTDPVLQTECYPNIPLHGEPMLSVDIALGGPTYVCISLTPPWHGKQYKIAAGFVRLKS